MKRPPITRDQIVSAHNRGWTQSQAAKHYGRHHTSIAYACEKFGIALRMHKFSPQNFSERNMPILLDPPKVRFSASPAAVKRALGKIQAMKKDVALRID